VQPARSQASETETHLLSGDATVLMPPYYRVR
jgi:hypothetical protein